MTSELDVSDLIIRLAAADKAFLIATPWNNIGGRVTTTRSLSVHALPLQVKPQTLSNLLYAFAALDCHPGAVFLASLSLAIERQAALFKPQELAASLWGFAMLRHHPGPNLVNVGLSETRRWVPSTERTP